MTATESPVIDITDQPLRDLIVTDEPGAGIVYTETLVYAAPEQFVADAPYQLAIVELIGGDRLTARITGDAVRIGDALDFVEFRNGIPFFRKA